MPRFDNQRAYPRWGRADWRRCRPSAPGRQVPHRDDCRSVRRLCGNFNHSRNRGRLGDKDSVACAHLGHPGTRTLIHPALKLGAHHMILGGQDGVAGLGSPCRHRDRCAQRFLGELILRVRQELRVRGRDVRGKVLTEFRRREEEILVRRRSHGIVGRGELLQQLTAGFAGVGLQCGHIDERTDLRVHTCLRDHRAAVAVTDQHHRALLLINDAPGGIDVLGEARERLLHDRHMVTILDQDVVDGPPAGAIHQCAVNNDNIFRSRLCLGVSHRSAQGNQDGNSQFISQCKHFYSPGFFVFTRRFAQSRLTGED
ncbi:hypothetical protein BN2476_300114 [Paraburkholderia piptadeniae]|uniref:Uncharacterized protein n=1 Tax=Paraburkholderia piptadeniae TaxID=1701573 RepID=A0A1N7S2Q5_9BURK|nr:hypothetical protein BN2476_300114 [Paraburkholderia piptadeniae]